MSDAPAAGFSDAMGPEEVAEGHDASLCNGRLKQARADGRTLCTKPAGYDTPHPGIGRCKFHGGSTPNHVVSAQHQQARALLGTLGVVADPSQLPPVVVHAELQLSMAKHLAAVRWLEQQAGAVPTERVPDSPWPKLLADHRRDADRLLVRCAELGIELAHLRLEEDQGRLIVGFVERLLRRLDGLVQAGARSLDPMEPAVRELVREELAAIEASEVSA